MLQQDMSDSDVEEVLIEITAEDKINFKRLDLFLVEKLPSVSRSLIKFLFEQGKMTASNLPPQVKLELKRIPPKGTLITIQIPPLPAPHALPQNIPLNILFEDEYLIVINKPAGLVVHPGAGNPDGTLVNALLYHCQNKGENLLQKFEAASDRFRPGIVHRLDKGTSGVMVAAKTQKCHEELVKLFSTHDIDRAYQALAMGQAPFLSGKIESTIGRHPHNRLKMAANVREGRSAITHYKVLQQFKKCFHVELKLETGRTHQIRVHLTEILKNAILNDPTYGAPSDHKKKLGENISAMIGEYPHPFLHAKLLGFVHPMTKKKLLFEASAPDLFLNVLTLLNGENPL